MMALKVTNALLTIVIDGDEQLALAKDVQRDPIKPVIEHIDLVIVRKGEKVTVDVPVHTEGEAAPETIVTVDAQTIQLEVEATHIPESIVVSVEGLEAGTQIKASELTLPVGATLAVDENTLVINVTQQISQEALDAEMAEAEAGIEHEEAGDAEVTEGDDAAAGGDAAEGEKAESEDA
jgi:large subunit ribosomal protein L25